MNKHSAPAPPTSESKLKSNFKAQTATRNALLGFYRPPTEVSRKSLVKKLSSEARAATHNGSPISLIFLKVADYASKKKKHGGGRLTMVLMQIELIFEGELRSRDHVGRYSEDILAVVLPESDAKYAVSTAKKLNNILKNVVLGNLDNPIKLSFKIGISTSDVGDEKTTLNMIAEAMPR